MSDTEKMEIRYRALSINNVYSILDDISNTALCECYENQDSFLKEKIHCAIDEKYELVRDDHNQLEWRWLSRSGGKPEFLTMPKLLRIVLQVLESEGAE